MQLTIARLQPPWDGQSSHDPEFSHSLLGTSKKGNHYFCITQLISAQFQEIKKNKIQITTYDVSWCIMYELSFMGLGRPWRCLTCIQMFQIHTVIVLVPVCFGCCSSNTKFYICRSKKDLAPKKSGMMWKMRVLTPECKSFPNIFRPTQ